MTRWLRSGATGAILLCLTIGSCFAQNSTNEWNYLSREADRLANLGDFDQAIFFSKKALEVAERNFGRQHTLVAASQYNLARQYFVLGQFAPAEPLCKRSLEIRQNSLQPLHPDIAQSLECLGIIYSVQGRFEQAEPLHRRALEIADSSLGPNHPEKARYLSNLAALYGDQKKYLLAEPLYLRAVKIRELTLGQDNPELAWSLNGLAINYMNQGKVTQAEELFKRALTIREKALGPNHPEVAVSLNNLAQCYAQQKQYSLAEPLYKRSITIVSQRLGPKHHDVGIGLYNLGSVYLSQGNYPAGLSNLQQALIIMEPLLDSDHPLLAEILERLADARYSQGQFDKALPLIRRSTDISKNRILVLGNGNAATQEAQGRRTGFSLHLSTLSRNPLREPRSKIVEESFKIAQMKRASATNSAITKMSAQLSKGDEKIAGLVKKLLDTQEHISQGEARLVGALSKPPESRNTSEEVRLRENLAQSKKEIELINAELTKSFPEFRELTSPEPISIKQVQGMLNPDEAMISFSLSGVDSFLWVIRHDKSEMISLKIDWAALRSDIKTIRSQMAIDDNDDPIKVDVLLLHKLYKQLMQPAFPYLNGVSHLIVVPDGPMQSLPIEMLVTQPPKEIRSVKDYFGVHWLTKTYAISYLPSASTIRAFRNFSESSRAAEPFIGIGDPVLTDPVGTMRSVRSPISASGIFRSMTAQGDIGSSSPIADVNLIKGLSSLPESADEIREMARVTNARDDAIFLQENATETNVKKLNLSKYRIVAFATHGAKAGEISKGFDPGLLLTPPKLGTTTDDGYLSASEIANLTLDSDWVLLSACNTAASDGGADEEGFSGLAKAFFYAGSRALFVSHWPVASVATVPLTTVMLREFDKNPSAGKAAAHQKSILSLMSTPGVPEYSHPVFWAPFVIVGDGGRIGSRQR